MHLALPPYRLQSSLSLFSFLSLVVLFSSSLFSFSFFFLVDGFEYLGCYKDSLQSSERDLIGGFFTEDANMKPSYCETQCAGSGFPYFGLQYGSECWCGHSYGKYGKVEEEKCARPCAGDKDVKCGGELTNSVYEATIPLTTSKTNEGKPLLGLVMIVKDEAHTLANTLSVLIPYIDVYFILDTGSTDGTQQKIRETLGEEKGEIWEEPFIDYGRSRNRVLEIAQQGGHRKTPPVFSLMLSADETVHHPEALRNFCEQYRDATGAMHEAYPIQMDVGQRFDSVRLSRTDKGWRYVGRVHEYLASPDRRSHASLRVPNTFIRFHATDTARRQDREYLYIKILNEEKAEKPTDTRTSFYLARTYNVVGNHSAALDEFQRRVSLGGWAEEVYESLYAIAKQKEHLGRSWPEVQQAFLVAYEYANERAEPLYAIAAHYYSEKQMALAYLYASHAARLPYPARAVLWVQTAVYEWQCNFLVGMAAFKLGPVFYEEGAKALMLALQKMPNDAGMMAQLQKYKDKMTKEDFKKVERIVNGEKIEEVAAQEPVVETTRNGNNPIQNFASARKKAALAGGSNPTPSARTQLDSQPSEPSQSPESNPVVGSPFTIADASELLSSPHSTKSFQRPNTNLDSGFLVDDIDPGSGKEKKIGGGLLGPHSWWLLLVLVMIGIGAAALALAFRKGKVFRGIDGSLADKGV